MLREFPSRAAALLIWTCLFAGLHLVGQSTLSESNPSSVTPESGFLSPDRYTSAFFGFSLPLPQDAVFQEQTLSLAHGAGDRLLLGLHSVDNNLVGFNVVATDLTLRLTKDPRKEIEQMAWPRSKQVTIGGRRFWRGESPRAASDRRMKTVTYLTEVDKYLIRFEIVSFDRKTTQDFEQAVEQISFFNPSQAKQMAGPDSIPYTPGAHLFPLNRIAHLSAGSVSGNYYRNEELGFRYEFPQDSVLVKKARGEEFAPGVLDFMFGNSPTVQMQHEAADQCTRGLLLVRRFPNNPATEEFNPTIILLAADPRCISESPFPKTVDDRDSLPQIASRTVAHFSTADFSPTNAAKVRSFKNGDHVMIEVLQSFALRGPRQGEQQPVLSSILMMEAGNYWVIWLFAADKQVELQKLRSTKIFFDDVGAPPTAPKGNQ